ncbi:AAA family ATPase [Pseudoroseomonas ludipueritiae]|uniref:AAA family ATPase n=1 Tax=Pseudoroseomonas ludipueritiae TaxID=198093 RepID=A0ABR7RFB1_9PROT|nr:AAA family ATPase [Pseudoroseomonas ludipueritiae]MBC9180162.1 AAA family ATPase [Pseudoroseomonas ludipueritiae]
MSFTIRPAVREKIGLLFGIAGASGSGKTFSALKLAKGIANGTGRIAVIDTEAGRALHYAPQAGEKADSAKGTFDFLHLDFQPPFTPERYIEAIRACEEAGATVIVIDSMSHEWAGEGGCSDIQAAEAERMAQGNPARVEAMTAPAWKKPKVRHQRMMSRLIQTRTHLIFCLRAQEKVKIVKRQSGPGTEIVPLGFMPICEKSFMFELSGSMTLHPDTPGEPRYDLQHKLNDELRVIFREGERIGDDAGKRLRMWAETGADRPAVDRVAEGVRELIERIQDADGMEALEAITSDPAVVKQIAWLAANRSELATRVNEAVTTALALHERTEAGQEEAA